MKSKQQFPASCPKCKRRLKKGCPLNFGNHRRCAHCNLCVIAFCTRAPEGAVRSCGKFRWGHGVPLERR